MPKATLDAGRLAPHPKEGARLARGLHHNPHAVLGAHALEAGTVVRAYHPDASGATLLGDGGGEMPMAALGNGLWGAFQADVVPGSFGYGIRFAFADGSTWTHADPYRFGSTIGERDLTLIGEGSHDRLWEVLGAHPRTVNGVAGTCFAVWAPNARGARVVGDFCRWDGRLFPMRLLGPSGVWELFVPGIGHGELYKYEIVGGDGKLRLKTDPLAFSMQVRPETASRVWQIEDGAWTDQAWMRERVERDLYRSPMAAYEVHLGSWMRNPDGSWLDYREAAKKLVTHCRRFGFTHVELLPVAEHPFDGSWGYQVTGYFAPTARFGSPDDFRSMVDTLHNAGIGVILDWVPAHFPTDEFALGRFDGTPLYEHSDPRRGKHPDWGTLIFDFGRPEVRNFLVANALFWLDQYHVDGLRVDAVASMLYLDYSRKAGEWLPNRYGGNKNLEAIAFLRELNEKVYAQYAGAFTVAEESTAFPGVSRPTDQGGLGFGFKWDLGWMHDTLAYFGKDPAHRAQNHDKLTFRGLYLQTEHFVLPLSHDEVVHVKGSLLGKMPGDERQRFANLRALLADMYTQPGKKLLFMGSELAPQAEWSHDHSLPWELAAEPLRAAFGRYLEDLGALYREMRALWAADPDPEGFAWIEASDAERSVLSYVRRADEDLAVVVLNLAPMPRYEYRLGMPSAGAWEEALNSDTDDYGGTNMGNPGVIRAEPTPWQGQPASTLVTLPPLAALILRPLG